MVLAIGYHVPYLPHKIMKQLRIPSPVFLTQSFRGWLLSGLCLVLISASAQAQLTVLSQGNKQAQWRNSQIAVLQQQLSDSKLNADLKAELQSQVKWLSAWKPGTLSEEPMWSSKAVSKLLVEPNVDPKGKAGKLRERLFGDKAKPTAEDTGDLQELLTQHDNDLGIRQLHLHWLDQPQYRKLYPQEIADASAKVLALLDAVAKPDQKIALARIFCLYRRGRALVYRELPGVLEEKPMSEEEVTKHEAELVGVYRQLKTLVPEDRPEFVLLDIRMLRHDHWNGRALAVLEDFGSQLNRQWYLRTRRDILRDLGWEGPAKEAANIYATAFPEETAQKTE